MNDYPGAAPTLVRIEIIPGALNLIIGDEQQMSAIGRYSDPRADLSFDGEVAWSTANHAIATIDSSGVLTVVGAGVTSVTASFAGVVGTAILFASTNVTFFWFRYALPSDSSDFSIPLPFALSDDTYAVKLAQSKGVSVVGLELPDEVANDRTTTQFRVVATAPLTTGDKVDVLVVP